MNNLSVILCGFVALNVISRSTNLCIELCPYTACGLVL